MKKLFSFAWLSALFFKPIRRKSRSVLGGLERLQLRTVPAAIAGMPVEDPETGGEMEELEAQDKSGELDEVVNEGEFQTFEFFGDETFEEGEIVEFAEGSEEFLPVDGEMPEEWMYFSMPMAATGFEGEIVEESGEVVEDGEETPREIKPYYRTLGAVPTSDEVSETSEEGEVFEDITTTGEVVDGEKSTVEDGSETEDGEVNPEIFYSLAGGGSDGGGEEEVVPLEEVTELDTEEPPQEVQTTAIDDEPVDDGSVDDNPEIRTLSGAGEEMTLQGVIQLGLGELSTAVQTFQTNLTDHVANFTQLVGIINAGFQQNALDIAAFAAAGNTAGIQTEIAQNQQLSEQLAQLVTSYVSGITNLHQVFVTRLTTVQTAIQQASANPAGISEAAESFNQTSLALPVFTSELAGKFSEVQDLIDAQNGNDDTNGFAPDEPNPNGDESLGLRIRQGNTSVNVGIAAIGASAQFTGDIANTAQPANGETVVIEVNLTNTDDTLGDEPVFIGSIVGTVNLEGSNDGAAFIGGSLTISGVKDDEPFSVDVQVPSDNGAVPTFDDDGLLVGVTGNVTLPAIDGFLPNGGVLTLDVSITPIAE